MRIRKLTEPRPFSFESSKPVGGKFSIANRSYSLTPAKSGYVIATGNERLAVMYRNGRARLELSNGKAAATIDYDFRRYPEASVGVRSGRVVRKASGHPLDVIREFRDHETQVPMGVGLKLLIHQKSVSREFRERLLTLIRPLIPYRDYFPYFRKQQMMQQGGRGGIFLPGGSVADPQCNYWCIICLLLGGPEDPFGTIECLICLICEIGSV